jgi:PBP1b-binding outer membrane lipoprotein LpoB
MEIMKNTIYLLFIALLLVSCSKPSCYEQSKDYVSQVKKLSSEFIDSANKFAGSSPLIQSSSHFSDMQDIRNQVDSLTVPECAQIAHDKLISYMDSQIDGYMSFMSQAEDSVINSNFDNASRYFYSWEDEFSKIATEPTP